MSEHLTGGPAFPFQFDQTYEQNFGHEPGMTVRQYAAIHLRVPESGDDWLDLMIRKANLRDTAAQAMAGMLGGETDDSAYTEKVAADRARRMAEALLRETDEDFNEIV
ncbi:hypothetical protein ABE527_14330 [Brucella sp. TWI432]